VSVRGGLSLLTLFPGRVGGSETYVRGLPAELGRTPGDVRLTILANHHVVASYRSRVSAPHSLHHVRSYRPGNRITTRALATGTAALLPRLAARDVPAELDHYPMTVPIPRVARRRLVTLH